MLDCAPQVCDSVNFSADHDHVIYLGSSLKSLTFSTSPERRRRSNVSAFFSICSSFPFVMANPTPSLPLPNPPTLAPEHWRWFWQISTVNDKLEEQLHPKAQIDRRTAELLHDYLVFKTESFKEIFSSLVWLANVQPASSPPIIRNRLHLEESLTFTDFLSFLRAELTTTQNSGVTLW
jgi:hypothetical protein